MTHIQININSKTYPAVQKAGQHIAIADLKLLLNSGEFICLVGPSGCGKTTLLNIIADLDTDYEGEIIVGRQHTHPKIGYIFQNPRLLPWRTVRENIELVLESNQNADIIDPLLEAMQLTQSQHV
ncbi:MAG: ATP-binding cassette domain-containing protein, partial [Methylobacter sp.]